MKRQIVVAIAGLLVLAGCTGSTLADVVSSPPVTLSVNVDDGATDVPVDTLVSVSAEDGTVGEVSLATSDGETQLEGEGSDTSWTAVDRLEPATEYTLTATGRGEDGKDVTITRTFTAVDLALDQQIYPAVAPLAGETVGVGMPVIVYFDLPVKDKVVFEREMSVTAEPETEGAWNWLSDREAHWRPKEYWKAGTKVHVNLRLNSLPAGDGLYGQQDQVLDFRIGRSVISKVDVTRHQMTVEIDGQVARTIPVSTGAPATPSRQGIKIVMEKHPTVDMDAASLGVSPSDPDYYNLKDVRWAMRLTNSGEFVHAAPWSAGSHGRANVSHACVGMSTENAGWLFSQSQRGDVVEFVGSSRRLEPQNGWTDWNVSWDDWLKGSALPAEEEATA